MSAITAESLRPYVDVDSANAFETFISDTSIGPIDVIEQITAEEGFAVLCIMVGLVHKNHDAKAPTTNDKGWQQQSKKKEEKNYDRIFKFVDYRGKTFNVITKTGQDSAHFVCYVRQNAAVGSAFLINEPLQSRNDVQGEDTIIVTTQDPFILLNDKFMNRIPESIVDQPTNAGECRGFILHNQKITCRQARIVCKQPHNAVSCTSFLCDRQRYLVPSGSCGCIHSVISGNTSPCVMETLIDIGSEKLGDRKITFRSFRTTKAVINDTDYISRQSRAELDRYIRPFRRSLTALVEYVNNNDGWDLCGVMTRATKQDVSNPDKRVASDVVTVHIAYLLPTKYEILSTPEYQQLKFRPNANVINILRNDNNTPIAIPPNNNEHPENQPINEAEQPNNNMNDIVPPNNNILPNNESLRDVHPVDDSQRESNTSHTRTHPNSNTNTKQPQKNNKKTRRT